MITREEVLALMQGDEFGGLPELLSNREDAVPFLLEILEDSSLPPFLRHRAAAALGETRSRTALPGIEAALADQDPVLRLMSARALVKIAGPEAISSLLPLTEDPDLSVAKVALQGLAKVGNETALASLERLRTGASSDLLQTEAAAAIQAIRNRTA